MHARSSGLRAVLVALLLATATTGSVSAETIYQQGQRIYKSYLKPASDPDKAYAQLSTSQQKAVLAFLTPKRAVKSASSVKSTARAPRQSSEQCYDQAFYVTAEGTLGNDLYTLRQTMYWCWQNGLITSYHSTRTGSTHVLFWDYRGITETTSWGGVGKKSVGLYTQAKFALCIIWKDIGCVQDENPWISMEEFARSTGVESGGR